MWDGFNGTIDEVIKRKMIKVNLIPLKKLNKMPVVMGVSLEIINFKLVGFTLLIHLIALPLSKSQFETLTLENDNLLTINSQKLEKLKSEGKVSKELEKEIELLKSQEEELKNKLQLIGQVLKNKKNPFQLLLFISKNIPNELWINKLQINDDVLLIKGSSLNYKNIGEFIETLQGSIFFGSGVKLENTQTVTNTKTKVRTEEFTILAKIQRFD
jgi:Tfp pilus assembly protein PilN